MHHNVTTRNTLLIDITKSRANHVMPKTAWRNWVIMSDERCYRALNRFYGIAVDESEAAKQIRILHKVFLFNQR